MPDEITNAREALAARLDATHEDLAALARQPKERRPMPPPPINLAVIPRSEGSEMRIAWHPSHKGSRVSMRLWTRNPAGFWHASSEGATFRVKDLPTLAAAVGDALERAARQAR